MREQFVAKFVILRHSDYRLLHFLPGQKRSTFLRSVVEHAQEVGIILVIDMNYPACIPKNCRHYLVDTRPGI